MKYLQQTADLRMTLESQNIGSIKWWIDASYAIHPDVRSHTGGVLIIGKDVLYTKSTRQKLATRSSTEGELVGVHACSHRCYGLDISYKNKAYS